MVMRWANGVQRVLCVQRKGCWWFNEYWWYSNTKDAISFCPSGLVDQQKNVILSHLHKVYQVVNQLRMIEDSLVIYRISRAIERRIFKIDVGNLIKRLKQSNILKM